VHSKIHRIVAGALALCALLQTAGPAHAQSDSSERTDLKIEIVGFTDSSKPRDLHLRVTNVSKWWSAETRASVATVPAGASDPFSLRIPDLDPKQTPQGPTPNSFEFVYGLTDVCNGTTVQASLTTGVDWKGDPETNLANNVVQAQVCPSSSPVPVASATPTAIPVVAVPSLTTGALASKPDPGARAMRDTVPVALSSRYTQSGAASAIKAAIPEGQRAGTHTVTLDPSDWVSTYVGVVRQVWPFPRPLYITPRGDLLVGWDTFPGDVAIAYQSAVNFDLTFLDKVPTRSISNAVLSFGEDEIDAKYPDGHVRDFSGCVQTLFRARADWAGAAVTGFIPSAMIDQEPSAVKSFDVTWLVDQWTNNQLPRQGVILAGSNLSPTLDESSSCFSLVHDLKLTITYVVPS
jgi:hypothetical protein